MVCVKAEVSGLDMCHSFACSVEGVAADLPTAAVMDAVAVYHTLHCLVPTPNLQ